MQEPCGPQRRSGRLRRISPPALILLLNSFSFFLLYTFSVLLPLSWLSWLVHLFLLYNTQHKHPCSQLDSNPQSEQLICRTPRGQRDRRSPDVAGRSELLYRLIYPGRRSNSTHDINGVFENQVSQASFFYCLAIQISWPLCAQLFRLWTLGSRSATEQTAHALAFERTRQDISQGTDERLVGRLMDNHGYRNVLRARRTTYKVSVLKSKSHILNKILLLILFNSFLHSAEFVNTKLINSTEQSPSWQANRSSTTQETTRILWNPKVRCRIYWARHLSLS